MTLEELFKLKPNQIIKYDGHAASVVWTENNYHDDFKYFTICIRYVIVAVVTVARIVTITTGWPDPKTLNLREITL